MKKLLVEKENVTSEDLKKLRDQYTIFEENINSIVLEVRDDDVKGIMGRTGALLAMYE